MHATSKPRSSVQTVVIGTLLALYAAVFLVEGVGGYLV